jgi:hypothetical protein
MIKVDEADLGDYGHRVSPGDEINGTTYEKAGWLRLSDGKFISEDDEHLSEPWTNDGGEACDLDNIQSWDHGPLGDVRYYGVLAGHPLPPDGVLAVNLRKWEEHRDVEPETRCLADVRMGKAIDLKARICGQIDDLFRMALTHKWSHARLLEERTKRILVGCLAQQMPTWIRDYVRGYMDASWRAFEATHTDSRWLLDGVLYERSPRRDAAFRNRWSDVRYAGVFYRGTDSPYYGGTDESEAVSPRG